jgi:hypothetical protein
MKKTTRVARLRRHIEYIKMRQAGHRTDGNADAVRQGDSILEDLREELRYYIVGVRDGWYGVADKALGVVFDDV